MYSKPVFYLKINSNTEFGLACYHHWQEIVNASGCLYYIICDNDELKQRIINADNKERFLKSSSLAKRMLRKILHPFWLNAGAALFTPFIHAKQNAIDNFFNIDADDTVMCCSPEKCVEILLHKVKTYSDNTDIDCFSLDMHSSAFERFYAHWTFGVTYVKLTQNFIELIEKYIDFFNTLDIRRDELFDNNIDEVFSILGKFGKISTSCFYIENMYFRHNNFVIHYCSNGKFVYRNVSQFTKMLWRLQDEEIENGIKIPDRFTKIDIGLSLDESRDFLESERVFNIFYGRGYNYFDHKYIAKRLKETGKKLVLFGAGKDGIRVMIDCKTCDIPVICFCDNSPNIQGTKVLDKNVIGFDELCELNNLSDIAVLITSSMYYNEIKSQLSKTNIEILNIVSQNTLFFREQLQKTYKLFRDNINTPIYLYGDFEFWEDFNKFYKDFIKYDLLIDANGFIADDVVLSSKNESYSVVKIEDVPKNAFIIAGNNFVEKQHLLLSKGRVNNYHFISSFELENIYKHIVYAATRKFQNFYNGGRCFILGNGSSLKAKDLDILCNNNEIVFASNNYYQWFEKTRLRPDYYFLNDNFDIPDIKGMIDPKMTFFLDLFYRGDLLNQTVCSYYWFEATRWMKCSYNHFKHFISNDLPFAFNAASVSYIMLQMAVNMGFDDIVFLGMDHDFQLNDFDLMEKSYQFARDYYTDKGINISNATRGGKLEIFDRVDFDSLFVNSDEI
jgi:hypothetical protein